MCTQVSVSDLSDDSVVKMFGLFSGGSDPTSGQKQADIWFHHHVHFVVQKPELHL